MKKLFFMLFSLFSTIIYSYDHSTTKITLSPIICILNISSNRPDKVEEADKACPLSIISSTLTTSALLLKAEESKKNFLKNKYHYYQTGFAEQPLVNAVILYKRKFKFSGNFEETLEEITKKLIIK